MGLAFLTWRRYLQRRLKPHGMTLKQFYVLNRLSRRDFMHPAGIAEELFCDRPTATVILKTMERNGWLGRERDPENAKRVRVTITEEGRRRLKAVQATGWRSREAFDPMACFSSEEKQVLEELLARLNRHLEQIEE
jgi:DNA-binding MarR family transcriptional regulator